MLRINLFVSCWISKLDREAFSIFYQRIGLWYNVDPPWICRFLAVGEVNLTPASDWRWMEMCTQFSCGAHTISRVAPSLYKPWGKAEEEPPLGRGNSSLSHIGHLISVLLEPPWQLRKRFPSSSQGNYKNVSSSQLDLSFLLFLCHNFELWNKPPPKGGHFWFQNNLS